ENVAQSGLRIRVSGLGTSVRLFRLRSDEHAPNACTSAAIANACKTIRFARCIAHAPNCHDWPDRAGTGFCASSMTLINRAFCLGAWRSWGTPAEGREQGRPRRRIEARSGFTRSAAARTALLISCLWLREANGKHPGDPQEQKVHCQ